MAIRPRPANVMYHSIVGVVPVYVRGLWNSWLEGTNHEVGDGVVSYTSAHLDKRRLRTGGAERITCVSSITIRWRDWKCGGFPC